MCVRLRLLSLLLAGTALPGAAGGALQHYGYYFGPDLNELDTVADHSNVALVAPGGEVLEPGRGYTGNCTDIYAMCAIPRMAAAAVANLTALRARNMTALVSVQTVFMGSETALLPIHHARWSLFWDGIKQHAGAILAFYPMDEPPQGCSGCYANMTRIIKASAPIILILAVFATAVARGLGLPGNDWAHKTVDGPQVDWVGYDDYNCWDDRSWLGDNASQFACYANYSRPQGTARRGRRSRSAGAPVSAPAAVIRYMDGHGAGAGAE
jgi:hypothetical protein